MLLNKFENKYIIKGIIKVLMPIHIGAGQQGFNPVEVDNGIIKDSNGRPFIPGSSLKGVLISEIERLIEYGFDSNYKCCTIVNSPCLDEDVVKKIKEDYKHDDYKIACEIYNNMCDVCRIFGSKHFASKLQIKDMTLLSEKAYTDIRDGVAIDRDTGTALDGKKYTFETVAAGTEFNFYASVDNLDNEHEDILKFIIGILKSGELKVGGKTSAGLGNIILKDAAVYRIDKNNIKEYLVNGLKDEMRWKDVQQAV